MHYFHNEHRNIYSKIEFLRKIHFRNVFFNILCVQFSIFNFSKIRNFLQTMSITMRLYRFFTNNTTAIQTTNIKKQLINENIKYEIFEMTNFDDIIIFFHIETFEFEIFNDKIYIRHDMISLFCNICKKSYFNNDDRVRLNNYMFNIHDVDIKSNQTMNKKQYIN